MQQFLLENIRHTFSSKKLLLFEDHSLVCLVVAQQAIITYFTVAKNKDNTGESQQVPETTPSSWREGSHWERNKLEHVLRL